MAFANQQATAYSDTVVRQFAIMTVVWGVVGMLVPDLAEAGVLPADQMIRIGAGGAGRCKHGYGGGHGGTGDRKTTHGKSPV